MVSVRWHHYSLLERLYAEENMKVRILVMDITGGKNVRLKLHITVVSVLIINPDGLQNLF